MTYQNDRNTPKTVGTRFIASVRLPHSWGKAAAGDPDEKMKEHDRVRDKPGPYGICGRKQENVRPS
jgi:hypothetical protein